MKRFKNILAIVNEPTRNNVLLFRATALASENGAALSIAATVPDIPKALTEKLTDRFEVHLGSVLQEKAAAMLKRYQARYETLIPISTKLLTGTPFIEIIREVIVSNHDLVMIQAPSTASRKSLLGSTELHLLRKCPCPVWIWQPAESPKLKRILAAVNVNTTEPQEIAMNRKILELSHSLAAADEAEWHVVHCWQAVGESLLRARGGASEDINCYVQDIELDVKAKLDACLEPFKTTKPHAHVHLLKGDPETLVPRVISDNKVELLVMGTLARSGIPGFFIGNIAERILNHVRCSVLTVKPDGFESPVQV